MRAGRPSNSTAAREDEAAALEQLKANWAQFAGVDKSTCLSAATVGGFASYVELLTCLEMARDLTKADDSRRGSTKLPPEAPQALRQDVTRSRVEALRLR